MLRLIAGVLTAAVVTGSSLAHAQTPVQVQTPVQEGPRLSQSDFKALTDARIALVKASLQLTPEQEKYWPALEEAIRARSAGRQQRLAALAEQFRQPREVETFELLRKRADNMAQRAAELKKLVDAWQPLWQTLNPDQKRRLGILAVSVIRVVRGTAETRHKEMEEDGGDEE
jgi:LTXXQ motif family protein